MTPRADEPKGFVARIRAVCLALPEVHEEEAWAGTRWTVRKRNFAHVVWIEAGWPPAYAQAAGIDGPCCVVTFRCAVEEVEAFRHAGHPYFVPVWFPNIIGMVLDDQVDWEEVAELVTESYCELAPKKLAALVRSADGESPQV